MAGDPDERFVEKGATIAASRAERFCRRRPVAGPEPPGQTRRPGRPIWPAIGTGQIVIALCDPLGSPKPAADVAAKLAADVVLLLELHPPYHPAMQSMDVLSSQATIAGYRAVLVAAEAMPKIFPMLTTAAGTITPARAFMIGAGVAGFQAIATARRFGAVVSAYDLRPAVKEQVQSLGGRFVELALEARCPGRRRLRQGAG